MLESGVLLVVLYFHLYRSRGITESTFRSFSDGFEVFVVSCQTMLSISFDSSCQRIAMLLSLS